MKKNIGISYKAFAVIMAAVLILGGTIGGTMAWLIDGADAVENTFTYGDINIDLKETTGKDYTIIPGVTIKKDPQVTVLANSEACWLFVKIKENNWPTFTETSETGEMINKVTYSTAEGWTALESETGVYYRKVEKSDENSTFNVLRDNQIKVSSALTKSEVTTVLEKKPSLTVTAYAVQQHTEISDVETAWDKAQDTTLY